MDTDSRLAEITTRAHASGIPWLVAELTEALAKLKIDGKVIDDLQILLAERDERIAGLLADADADFDEKVVPA